MPESAAAHCERPVVDCRKAWRNHHEFTIFLVVPSPLVDRRRRVPCRGRSRGNRAGPAKFACRGARRWHGPAGHAGLGGGRAAAGHCAVGRVLRPAGSRAARGHSPPCGGRRAGGAFPRGRTGEAGRPALHRGPCALRSRGGPGGGPGRRRAGPRVLHPQRDGARHAPVGRARHCPARARRACQRPARGRGQPARGPGGAADRAAELGLHAGARARRGAGGPHRGHGGQLGGGGGRRAGAYHAGLGEPDLCELRH